MSARQLRDEVIVGIHPVPGVHTGRVTGHQPADKLAAYIEHFRGRVLQDALLEATANYWLRRAKTFEAVGNPRCDEIALACRRHATLVPLGDDELVAAALGEVA